MWRWLFGAPTPTRAVVVYSRADCPLCDEAVAEIERAGRRFPLTLVVTDVDADPALVAEYGEWVPVVVIEGKVRFRGRVNRVLLARELGRGAV
jgi:glutaredoxin